MKNVSWRTALVLAIMIAGVIYVIPTLRPGTWPHKKINLGLDLQGGMQLDLEVEVQKAVEGRVSRLADDLREEMRKARVHYRDISVKGMDMTVVVKGQKFIDGFNKVLDDNFAGLKRVSENRDGDQLTIVLSLQTKEIDTIEKSATVQALETIRNRIDQFGVSEPDIRRQGERRILIQLPGIKDIEGAKRLIGKTAQLEFKLVDDSADIQKVKQGLVPGEEVLYEVHRDDNGQTTGRTPMVVQKRSLLTGADLSDAKVEIDSQYGEPYVSITFDKKGGQIFSQVTGENVHRRLAIVLDNTIHSAPVIQERIPNGTARITGNFTMNEARDLAIVLRSGALPAPVKILEERTVGPSLGSDSIHEGIFSAVVGGLLVVLFMAIYYKMSGLIADVALLLNIVLIAAGLAAFQATLTLPGIAGIILTIGMAVDSNVLIFERIREELAVGKTVRGAIEAGYERATLTILDANITTLISALVLFQFGTGPVKGFAVTLSLGVVSSVFTALVVTKVIFDYILAGRQIKTLSI